MIRLIVGVLFLFSAAGMTEVNFGTALIQGVLAGALVTWALISPSGSLKRFLEVK